MGDTRLILPPSARNEGLAVPKGSVEERTPPNAEQSELGALVEQVGRGAHWLYAEIARGDSLDTLEALTCAASMQAYLAEVFAILLERAQREKTAASK